MTAAISIDRSLSLAEAPAAPVATTQPRWLALDLFRFAAVLLMIQGHVFFEVVDEAVRGASWYGYHGYVHGFTAPIFLFSSGLAFGITTFRKWDHHTKLGRPVYKRFERYAMIVAIGYLMHLHHPTLSWLLSVSPERLAGATRVDALQHIGVALMLVGALVLVLKNKTTFLVVLSALTLVALLCAPFMWGTDLSMVPVPLRAWLTNTTGSIFPLVPWCGFLFSGVLTARFVETRRTKKAGPFQLFVPLAALAIAFVVFGDRMAHSGFDPFPEHNFWKTSPWFFFIRLGGVIGLLAVLTGAEGLIAKYRARLGRSGHGPIVRFVQIAGGQTLVLYVAHLMLLYGTGLTPGVNGSYHRGLSLGPAVGLVMLFFAAMGLLAYLWHWTKKNHLVAYDRVRYSLVAVLFVFFLIG